MAERSAKGTGSVRQRSDGTWEARCSINGKRRSFYGEKQADALKAMRDAQKAVDDKTYCDPTKMTFGEWLDTWLEVYIKPKAKRRYYENLFLNVNKKIKPKLGNIKLQSLSSLQIQNVCNNFLTKMKPLSVQTGVLSPIFSALEQAIKCKYITSNPANGCSLPKTTKKLLAPFTKEEISAFIQELEKGEKFKNLFVVALFTGMRKGELLGLSWDEIDFENDTIKIKQQIQRGVLDEKHGEIFYIQTPKNGKERIISPPKIVMQTLKEERRLQLLNKIHAGSLWENKWDLVFTDQTGGVLRESTIFYRFKKIVSAINRPDMRFHDLRHTYAVMALQSGVDPKTVQHTLGHHTAAFTLDVYAHVTEDMNKNSATRIQEYYNQLTV